VIETALTQVVNGLSLASILILIALGLAVIFGLLGVINLAHADLFMTGMYALVFVQGLTGNFWLGVLAAPIAVGAIGFVVERGVVRWLRTRPLDTLLATLGVGIVLREGVKLMFGAGYRQVANPLPGNITIGPVSYPIYRLLLIAITIAILAGLALWLYRTAPGLRLRAMLQDRETAAAYGINPDRAGLYAFVVGSALAGLAGALMSPLVTVGPDVGIIYLARAFMVVVVGGVGSLLGLIGGGVIIGGGDALAGYFLNPTIANAAVLVLAVIILRFRPGGLFR
jgi:branched-chain amino acid transport system permease protein/urea transport system permease protein